MSERQQHMNKALRFLRSVKRRAESDEPDTVAPTAYYAMHHAARAVLLHRRKVLPKTDASFIALFASTVHDLGPEGRNAGAALEKAFATHSTGEFAADVRLQRKDAIAARDSAQSFVDYCRSLQRKPAAKASVRQRPS